MKVTFFFFSPEYILAHNISVPVIRTENWTWLPSEEQQSAKASQSSQPEECMSLTDCQERLTAAGSTAAGSNNFDFFFLYLVLILFPHGIGLLVMESRRQHSCWFKRLWSPYIFSALFLHRTALLFWRAPRKPLYKIAC